MTVQASHSFVDGARILGAQLAHCSHCETMRIVDPERDPRPRYVRRSTDVAQRDTFDCPPCVAPVETKAAAARVAGLNAAREREQAVRVAVRDAPRDVEPAPKPAPLMLPNFPWYSDLQR